MDFTKCGFDNFNYDKDDVKTFGIDSYQCVTDDEYYIQGNFYRK